MANLLTSSIGKKLIMSLTGAFLVLFLVFHLVMNMLAVFSAESYNMVCGFLGANWYALLGTAVLAGGAGLHIVYAFYLTLLNYIARGSKRYAVGSRAKGVSWASQNMLVLGFIVVCGLGVHLFNFWYNMQWVEITMSHEEIAAACLEPQNGAAKVAALFANPVYCVIYLAWFVALWFHLTHGVWSMFQSAGLDNKVWLPRLKCVANIAATLIMLGFAFIVVFFYVKSLL